LTDRQTPIFTLLRIRGPHFENLWARAGVDNFLLLPVALLLFIWTMAAN